MTGGGRLLALRLQGFKSFAERTTVEFGPGINAVVGPNGSGKSNLVDALRWALGEQGRALRSRRAEDVVFAGSERRGAVGMADVTLVLDNLDRLLPVDYSVVELSRRLYRSGENEYQLNRGRVRLRDIVDLLDAAHLADNAFLFIGQGMVDQALSLRPEERRPLFEEVAGVRRHDRRRRHALEQLVEAESNLARVEDILAELRPQARRLRIQAEQQESRARAVEDLAGAILAAGHARWFDGAARAAALAARMQADRAASGAAAASVEAAERRATDLARDLATRAKSGEAASAELERARARLSDLRVRMASAEAESAALVRDRERAGRDLSAAEQDLERHRAELAVPVPDRDASISDAVEAIERALADATRELSRLRGEENDRDARAGALARAREARRIELAAAQEQLGKARRSMNEAALALDAAGVVRDERATAHAGCASSAAAAREEEARATAALADARAALDRAERASRAAEEGESAHRAAAEMGRARLESLRTRLDEVDARGLPGVAHERASRRLADGLDVLPALRIAVEAALGAAIRAHLVDRETAALLAGERASVVVAVSGDEPAVAEASAVLDRARRHRGGSLRDAIRRDPSGAIHRLLGRSAWVPELADALELLPVLPVGWLVVTRAGDVVRSDGLVTLGAPESLLELRAAAARAGDELTRLEERAEVAGRDTVRLLDERTEAWRVVESLREAETASAGRRRKAEEEEQSASRDLERSVREVAWLEAQSDRSVAEAARREAALRNLETTDASAGEASGVGDGGPAGSTPVPEGADDDLERVIRSWDGRIAALRARRARVLEERVEAESLRQAAEARHARASAAVELDEGRIARAEAVIAGHAEMEERATRTRSALANELEEAVASEAAAAGAVERARAADADVRRELAAIETGAATARDAQRAAEERLRAAELAEVEARLGLEALREQLLVDLGALGDEAHDAGSLLADAGPPWYAVPPGAVGLDPDSSEAADAASVERVVAELTARWAIEPPASAAPSGPALVALRRRLHEVGSANPFAAREHEEVRVRLASLDEQAADLRTAIERTRSLIAELDELIAGQFRATFQALEGAFDARFRQLFGGGFARLSLTDPADLASTGVEIAARPPGKKLQALAMLSGGERTLTAVALLFAMLEVRPVPFCVLDEVDAALDEANIGRFADALSELSQATQFIVITHNRGTIERADALFGVTVREDAVSRVVSLRLEEARALARPGDAGRDSPGNPMLTTPA